MCGRCSAQHQDMIDGRLIARSVRLAGVISMLLHTSGGSAALARLRYSGWTMRGQA